MTNEDWHKIFKEKQEQWNKFVDTEIGKAFVRFENATINYWRVDSNENVSMKKLNKLDAECKEAKEEFLKLLTSS